MAPRKKFVQGCVGDAVLDDLGTLGLMVVPKRR